MTNSNGNRLDRVERLIEQIGERVDANAKGVDALKKRVDVKLERRGKILDYLMHRDGNGNGA